MTLDSLSVTSLPARQSTMSPRYCLVVASVAEYRAAVDILQHLPSSQCDVVKCGIGAVGFNESFSARLEDNDYAAVIIAGLCGGLSPELERGDRVIYDNCRTANGSVDLDSALTTKLLGGLKCAHGTGFTVSNVVTSAKAKRDLWREFGALAVDMETFQVASICRDRSVPAVCVRVVSDSSDEDLPDFNRVLSRDGEIIGWRVPSVLLSSPMASLRFLSSMKATMETFKRSIDDVLALVQTL